MAVDGDEPTLLPQAVVPADGLVSWFDLVSWFCVPVLVGVLSLVLPLRAELASPNLGSFFEVLEVVWPATLLVLMVLLTYQVRDRHSDDGCCRVAGWCLAGWALVAGLATLLIGHQAEMGVAIHQPGVVVSDMAIAGAALGLLVGRYDVERCTEYAEVRRLNGRLEFLNELLGHDVRNDVAVVDAYAQGLAADYGPDERVDGIRQKVDHVTELIHAAGELNEIETADGDLQPVDPSTIVRQAVGHAREGFPEATVRVEGELPASVTVRGDSLVGSVFDNLLRNAVQHGGPSPEIVVSMTASADEVRVSIADDGPGVPDSVREDLFGEGTTGEGSAGTGLGLYLVSRLVDRYGGRVEVEENEPTGTVFTVRLPRSD
ncbi:MAG: HAMP domain-containing sensor histidine kinase [Haloarculaceae archaeon]